MECWQWGQLDLGRVMDCPWGIRWMQTFKKLPIANPKAITNASIIFRVYLAGAALSASRAVGQGVRRSVSLFILPPER